MAAVSSEVRSVRVVPDSIATETFLLSPNDLYEGIEMLPLCYPFFFNYDIDGDRLIEALKKFLVKYPLLCGRLVPDEDTRYAIEVDAANNEKHSIPFSEWRTDLSIAAIALNHSQAKAESAQFPVMPDIPFFVDINTHEGVIRGDEPLMKVRLTHCPDGCILSVCIRHMVMDGQRYAEACRDIGRAYRGEEIPNRTHNRSYLWPDQMAEHYDCLGDEIRSLPRKMSKGNLSIDYISFPDESCQNCALYFSEEVLKKLKEHVQPFLKDGEFVSTNDVLMSFCWMLGSELILKPKDVATGGALDIGNTFVTAAFEALKNGIDLVPENYAGNAVMTIPIINQGDELNEAPLNEVFAKLALTMRGMLNVVRGQPAVAVQGILFYYTAMNDGKLTTPMPIDRMRGLCTNLMKIPADEIDFGQGRPVFVLLLYIPYFTQVFAFGPGFDFDGVIVQATLLGSQAAALKNSAIIKQFAPEVREVHSDFTLEELKKRMKVSQ